MSENPSFMFIFVSSAGLFQHLGWVFNIYTKLNIFSSYIQSLNTEYNVAIFFIDS